VQVNDFKVGTIAGERPRRHGRRRHPAPAASAALEAAGYAGWWDIELLGPAHRGGGVRVGRAAAAGGVRGALDVTPDAGSVVVESDGLASCALVWGRDADPTVVLVHGNGAHGHWWEPLCPSLVPGMAGVAIDLRGHGESGWPATPAYAMPDFERDLAA
jgi:hypothetical protein